MCVYIYIFTYIHTVKCAFSLMSLLRHKDANKWSYKTPFLSRKNGHEWSTNLVLFQIADLDKNSWFHRETSYMKLNQPTIEPTFVLFFLHLWAPPKVERLEAENDGFFHLEKKSFLVPEGSVEWISNPLQNHKSTYMWGSVTIFSN